MDLGDRAFLRNLSLLQYGTPLIVNNCGICSSPQLRKRLGSSTSFVKRFRTEHRLQGHRGCVNCINFSFEGNQLVSGSDDLKIIIWDWRKGQSVMNFQSKHFENIFQTKFMPGSLDRTVVSCARDGQIKVHFLSDRGEVSSKTLAKHKDSAHKLSVESDSPHVFMSCGEDGAVMQLDLRDSRATTKLLVCRDDSNHRLPLYSIFTDPSNSNYFAISGRDQFARIYDKRTLGTEMKDRTPVKLYCPDHLKEPRDEFSKTNITCLVYSYDGSELLCSYNDEDIYLFDTTHSSGSNYISKYSGHRNSVTVKGVNFYGPKSEYVVSGSDCGNVFLWDKKSTDIVQCLTGDHEGVVNCLEPHPHLPVLAVSGLDHDVKVFTPTASGTTKLDDLSDKVEANNTAREQDRDRRLRDPSPGVVLLNQFMRSYLRSRVRRSSNSGLRDEMENGNDDDDDDNSSGEDSDVLLEHGPYIVHDIMGDDDYSGDSDDSDAEPMPSRHHIARCISS